jgi:SAM-dependent methyltransferase
MRAEVDLERAFRWKGRVNCPLCAAPAPPPAFVKDGWPIARCACGMVFVARTVDPAVLEALYGEGYFAGGFDEVVPGYRGYELEEPVMRRNFARRLALIERLVPPGPLLDVGCALGFFVRAARARGWDARGIELSEYAAAQAAASGLPVARGDFLTAELAPASLAAVSMLDMLEHVADPRAYVRRARAVLAPGGVLAIETADLDSLFACVRPALSLLHTAVPSEGKDRANVRLRTFCHPVLRRRRFENAICSCRRCLIRHQRPLRAAQNPGNTSPWSPRSAPCSRSRGDRRRDHEDPHRRRRSQRAAIRPAPSTTSRDAPRCRRYISSTHRNPRRPANSARLAAATSGSAPGNGYGTSAGHTSGKNSAAAVRSATVNRSPTRYPDGCTSASSRSNAASTFAQLRAAPALSIPMSNFIATRIPGNSARYTRRATSPAPTDNSAAA